MKRSALAAMCSLVLISSAAQAQQQQPAPPAPPAPAAPRTPDAATIAAARRLLAVSGATKLMLSSMETMIDAQKQGNPQIPATFWDAFLARAKRDTTRLLDMLVPIYAGHMTQADLEELIKFYSSPSGQRFIAAQPAIVQESTQAGQSWGELIARMVGDSLQRAQGNLPPNR
jgi:uncharacterized protein